MCMRAHVCRWGYVRLRGLGAFEDINVGFGVYRCVCALAYRRVVVGE